MIASVSAHGPALLRTLAGSILSPAPIWLMRQAGRYLPEYREIRARCGGFLAMCFDPEAAAEVTLQPIRRYGLDAAIIFSDILVVPHALGQPVAFEAGEGPRLDPVRDTEGLAGLRQGDTRALMRAGLAPVYEAVARVRASLSAEVALIGFAGAPWTVACYMVEGAGSKDYLHVKRWAYGDPDGFARLIDRLVDATADHLSLQVEAGAQVLQIFDSWSGVLPEEAFRRWVIDPTDRLVTILRQRHPDVPVIGFPRGAGPMIPAYAQATGVRGLALDTTVPLGFATAAVPPALVLQGNLDPVHLLVGGDAMRAAADRILDAMVGRPFIFNLGHGVLQQTPPQNVAALVAHVRSRPSGAGQG